jgi:catechol 2,3-dioxygenase-like lactoylglutathione lyase family enzyme
MDMKFEVAVLPVTDVDRTKHFYKTLGWREDADFVGEDGFRVVQLTPPGSSASIIFGSEVSDAAPGSAQGLHLVVTDIEAARAELAGLGVDVSEVFHDAGGVFHHAGTAARVAGPDPDRTSYASFATFTDPDGNGWVLQEITTRLPVTTMTMLGQTVLVIGGSAGIGLATARKARAERADVIVTGRDPDRLALMSG